MNNSRDKTPANAERRARETLLLDYIHAKDGNRPHLMRHVFADTACLEMQVKSEAIQFPPVVQGEAAIADVLSRRFNQNYENIYTFYLGHPGGEAADRPAIFSCDWLVGMSDKAGGSARVGCGRYEWVFQTQAPWRVERLLIVIEQMLVLPPARLPDVLGWLQRLDYPWTSTAAAVDSAPPLRELSPVLGFLARSNA